MVAFGTAERAGLKITTVTDRERYRTADTEYFKAGFERTDYLTFHSEGTTSHSTSVRDYTRV